MKLNKTQAVLKHIKERGSIDAYVAINLYDVRYLPSTIRDIRKLGYETIKNFKTNYLSGQPYAVYSIKGGI